jgi:hypothetical protein
MGVPCLGMGWSGPVSWITPGEVGINRTSDEFSDRQVLLLASFMKLFQLELRQVKIGPFLWHGIPLDIQQYYAV